MDFKARSLLMHEQFQGKIEIASKVPMNSQDDLSLAYTPGVAAPCLAIAADPQKSRTLTCRGNSVAVVTDGSAVLGLGNIGPLAAMPVMEGKALLFKRYGNVDAWPICLATQDADEIVETVRRIAPSFGGINLEDISAPRCFEIEERLQDLGIPVFHDDQNGTAIAVLAALINAGRALQRPLEEMRVVISGAGAAGMAVAKLLLGILGGPRFAQDVILCDSRGVLCRGRTDLNSAKLEILEWANLKDVSGSLQDALKGADVFIGLSKANLLNRDDIRRMRPNSIILAMANPEPEIFPDEAKAGGAAIVATGRSDFPNQVNNVLVFPGLFRGLLDAKATKCDPAMYVSVAQAIAQVVELPTAECIMPNVIRDGDRVAQVVAGAILKENEKKAILAPLNA
ncbi:MAG: NADP-dependent malic enzyme [Verrucomicrobia bacterium]|nr:NADP-dependent malic enzyme [Verrucomicrobiota bacterium]